MSGAIIKCNGVTIAKATQTTRVSGYLYVPHDALVMDHFVKTEFSSS